MSVAAVSVAVSVAVVGAAFGVLAARTWSRRRGTAALEAARTRAIGRSGVFVGADSITLDAPSDRGILILHGFNDTPQSVANLAYALNANGWVVSAPLLPSHGRADDEIERSGNADVWIEHAQREWDGLRQRVPNAVLCGQSMGGAIAAVLAVRTPPRALVLLAPYLAMGKGVRFGARIWPLWQVLTPMIVSDGRRALRDDEARARGLGRGVFSPRLVAQLRRIVIAARRALPAIRVPTLVVHSRGDYRIPSTSAMRAFEMIAASDKMLEWRDNTGHVLAADRGHEELAAKVAAWLSERVPRT